MNFASINIINNCVRGPDLGAIVPFIYVAAAVLVFGSCVGGYAEIYIARPTAGLSLIIALLLACIIVRFERRQ
jgi:hypothetical protein